ncbi:tRNA lysidine(34) synthetase TilS [Actinotalea sp. K2]|uniref:tRNA lysidine(34) synthetase TilS n=1 Tax=Actinotalea sp. K2 TaxID=2939438 RepID=UPI00201728AA|nr:tRNA lysidine(34) synthetase TilS [Actinotalea sp. K2]MCL3861448.1 tRNA lysidine(34) synthetase TilS [Actinotalea sp. K2]
MTGPHPAVAAHRSAVRSALGDLPSGALVLVACSGGADSLALAGATAFVAPRVGLRAGAVVVDHGLQEGSAGVAQRAADRCRELGLDPVDVVRVEVGTLGGPESAARTARYAALESAAQERGASAVLLGHTLDDQAETVLLGLARGAGARSLAGMAAGRGLLRRPLLGLRRADSERACVALGLEPWDDPTNDPRSGAGVVPLRSRVRHEVLPVLEQVLGPGVAQALARTATQLGQDADALDEAARGLLDRATCPAREGAGPTAGRADAAALELDVEAMASAPPAVRLRALHQAAVAVGVPPGSVLRAHLVAADALVADWHGQGPVALPGGVRATRRCGRLALLSSATQGASSGGPG